MTKQGFDVVALGELLIDFVSRYLYFRKFYQELFG